MNDLRKAAQQALEALESADWYINQLEQIVYSDDDTETHEERAKVQAAITALRAALDQPKHCTWHGDEEGTYETSCKHLFQIIDGTPEGNGFKNCCFCGLWLESHPWEDSDDE